MRKLELIGQKFWMLTCIGEIGIYKGHLRFKFICECGVVKILIGSQVKRGNYKSCGCWRSRTKVPNRNHPLYDVWKGMKARCRDKKHIGYKIYGGKGVKVCEEWKHDYNSFFNWAISNDWKQGMQIDKDIIAQKLGLPALLYSPEMCSIVTHADNCRISKQCKINKEIAEEIRKSDLPYSALAKKYLVNKSTIQRVKSNIAWN